MADSVCLAQTVFRRRSRRADRHAAGSGVPSLRSTRVDYVRGDIIMKAIHRLLAAAAVCVVTVSTACGSNHSDELIGMTNITQELLHTKAFVDVNGARLYYEKKGQVTAARQPPIVLVHGLSLDSSMWDPQFEALAQRRLTYRYDLRGHGQSSPATGAVALHDDLLGFLDAMEISSAHLVGLSLGGNAVAELAAAHPERAEKIVLIDSGVNGFQYPSPNVLQRIPTYLQLHESDGRDAALQAWLRDPLFAVSFADDDVRQDLERMVLGCPCSLFFNPQFQIRPDTWSRLPTISTPTLVLVGELDTSDFQAASESLHERIPGAIKQVISGAGHMANMDAPKAVLDAIIDFCAPP